MQTKALKLAMDRLRRGRLPAAERLAREILENDPRCSPAWFVLGTTALRRGSAESAVSLLQRAVDIGVGTEAGLAAYHANLGEAYRRLNKTDKALVHLRQASRLDPRLAEAQYWLGLLLLREGGSPAQAIPHLERACSIQPEIDVAAELGDALRDDGQVDRAIEYYRRRLMHYGETPGLLLKLGIASSTSGDVGSAIAYYQRALALRPDYVAALMNLGSALVAAERPDEGIDYTRRGLALVPDDPRAHSNLGTALLEIGRVEEAIASFRRVLELDPANHGVHSTIVAAHSYLPKCDARAILGEAEKWRVRHADPLANHICPFPRDRAERRLRIGYVSGEFNDHVESHFLMPLLANHDRQRYEIFCYSYTSSTTARTDRFRSCADGWRNILKLSDSEAAELIRQDGIDVLVDLAMHQTDSRPLIFAHKPAPVQLCWLAYPGTTGQTTIDYRVTDAFLDPVESDTTVYSETSVRIADSSMCYDPFTTTPEEGPLPASANGYITFGSLNKAIKLNRPVLELWACVLSSVPDARFILRTATGSSRDEALDLFAQRGVDPDRVECIVRRLPSRHDYLKLYQRIDIALDTFPYNGHTTAFDSFWMGVPVVTLVGNTVVGRVGLSLAMNLGLPELAADTSSRYVDLAVQLARDQRHLAELRAALRSRMQASPLMNAPAFARKFEAMYDCLWEGWRSSGRSGSLATSDREKCARAFEQADAIKTTP